MIDTLRTPVILFPNPMLTHCGGRIVDMVIEIVENCFVVVVSYS